MTRAELAAVRADGQRLADALAKILAHPRWVSIGSIDSHAELTRPSRREYDEAKAALASWAAHRKDSQ